MVRDENNERDRRRIQSVDGWGKYQEFVLNELERISESIQMLDNKLDKINHDEISEMKIKIAMLEVRSGIFGAAAGTLAGVVLTLIARWHF